MTVDLKKLAADLALEDVATRIAAAEALCHVAEEARSAAVPLVRASSDESEQVREWTVGALEGVLYACDELAGFCTAAAMVRPEKIHGMQATSVRKTMKSKGFAANVSRGDIVRGAADLGVELDEHIQFVIDAMGGSSGSCN